MSVEDIAETALGPVVREDKSSKKKKSKKQSSDGDVQVNGTKEKKSKKRKNEDAFLEQERGAENVAATNGHALEVGGEDERTAKKRRKQERREKKAAEGEGADLIKRAMTSVGRHTDREVSSETAAIVMKAERLRRKAESKAKKAESKGEAVQDDKAAARARRKAKKAQKAAETMVRKDLRTAKRPAEDAEKPSKPYREGEFVIDTEGAASTRKSRKNTDLISENKTDMKSSSKAQAPALIEGQPHYKDYAESPMLTDTPQSQIDDFLKKNSVAIDDPLKLGLRPILDFQQVPSTNLLCHYVLEKFQTPTAIQSSTWPYAFASRDMIGVAETGSGKTLAFGLPLARHIKSRLNAGGSCAQKAKRSPMALVLTPTRELAVQIHEQLEKLAASNAFNVCLAYGGVDKAVQVGKLQKCHCLVATPGRLKDFISMGKYEGVVLDRCQYVVLDEADRMLDKGFEDDVKEILGTCPTIEQGRQTVMFTATWPTSIQKLASTYMDRPVKVTMGNRDGDELRANEKITQIVEVMGPEQKLDRLRDLLKEHTKGSKNSDRILVFCLYKKEAARIEETIRRRRFSVGGIHGDLSQQARSAALAAFKAGEVPILVATDVAARGLDIPAVKLVLNHTFPLTVEDYVHRIGRTGRAGQEGLAITFFTEHEKGLAGGLANVLRAAKQDVPEDLAKFGGTVKKKGHDLYGAFAKEGMEGMTSTKITFD